MRRGTQAVLWLMGFTGCSDSLPIGDAGPIPATDAPLGDATTPDSTAPDAILPDGAVSDDASPDATLSDASRADGVSVDATLPPAEGGATDAIDGGAFRVLWAKAIDGDFYPNPVSIAPLTDGGFVFGATAVLRLAGVTVPAADKGIAAVAKFDALGAAVWQHQFGEMDIRLEAISNVATDGHDGIAIGGTFGTSINFGGGALQTVGGTEDIFVSKLDSAGAHVWSKQFGGTAHDDVRSLAFFGNGQTVFAGQFDPNNARFGNVVLGAGSGCFSPRYVATLTANGDTESVRCFSEVERAAADADGHAFVAEGAQIAALGATTSSPRPWALQLTGFTFSSGVPKDEIAAMTTTAAGDVVFTGRIEGSETHQGDAPRYDGYKLLVGKVQANGDVAFVNRIVSSGAADTFRVAEAQGQALAVGPDGSAWVAGLFAGSLDFGAGPMVGGSNHADEGFVVQFGPKGEYLRSLKVGVPVESILVSADGSITIAGHFSGNLRIGDVSLDASPTAGGVFIARLMP